MDRLNRKIVFMVHTEYHLMLAIGMKMTYYNNPNDEVVIYRVSPINGSRLSDVHYEYLGSGWKEILYDYNKPSRSDVIRLMQIVDEHPNIFFFFSETKHWQSFLFSKLIKIGTSIVELPDGMNCYVYEPAKLLTWLKTFLVSSILNARLHILFPLYFPRRTYANDRRIDKILLEHPDSFAYHSNKHIEGFEIRHDKNYIETLNKVFAFNPLGYIESDKKYIFFIDGAFNTNRYFERAIEIIRYVIEQYDRYQLIIKLHPNSNVAMAKKYFDTVPRVQYINSSSPAELFIMNMNDSIIMSVFSTAMLMENKSCRYYWLSNMFHDVITIKGIKNPTSHIRIIHNLKEIK